MRGLGATPFPLLAALVLGLYLLLTLKGGIIWLGRKRPLRASARPIAYWSLTGILAALFGVACWFGVLFLMRLFSYSG